MALFRYPRGSRRLVDKLCGVGGARARKTTASEAPHYVCRISIELIGSESTCSRLQMNVETESGIPAYRLRGSLCRWGTRNRLGLGQNQPHVTVGVTKPNLTPYVVDMATRVGI